MPFTSPLSPEWITAIAAALTTVSVLLIYLQIRYDHERSRRKEAISLMQLWTSHPHALSSALAYHSRNLVEDFSQQQCLALYNRETVEYSKKLAPKVDRVRHEICRPGTPYIPTDIKNESDGDSSSVKPTNPYNELTPVECAYIGQQVTLYLNVLETVATAWRHNVADRAIIEEEFLSLFMPHPNIFTLENYRKATGVYPSLQLLSDSLQESRKSNSSAKRKLA